MTMKFYATHIVAFSNIEKGDLALWTCNNTAVSGKVLLMNYKGTDYSSTIYVPTLGGRTLINRYYNVGTSPNNIPFYNVNKFKYVDLQYVPFRDNNMEHCFNNCVNLKSVYNINNNVTSMFSTFYFCYNLTTVTQLPAAVQNLSYSFQGCNNLVTSPDIPRYVTHMSGCFKNCSKLKGRINVYATEITSALETFYNTDRSLTKQVYIYYKYKNGVNTKTYNTVVATSYSKWDGKNGVTVYNMGSAPW